MPGFRVWVLGFKGVEAHQVCRGLGFGFQGLRGLRRTKYAGAPVSMLSTVRSATINPTCERRNVFSMFWILIECVLDSMCSLCSRQNVQNVFCKLRWKVLSVLQIECVLYMLWIEYHRFSTFQIECFCFIVSQIGLRVCALGFRHHTGTCESSRRAFRGKQPGRYNLVGRQNVCSMFQIECVLEYSIIDSVFAISHYGQCLGFTVLLVENDKAVTF